KAEQDYLLAQQGSRSEVPVHDGVCFHCQQCAEKYCKGMMEEIGLPVPKTHDLNLLLNALRPHYATLRTLRRGLLFLTLLPWTSAIRAITPAGDKRLPLYAGLSAYACRRGRSWAFANVAVPNRGGPRCPGIVRYFGAMA